MRLSSALRRHRIEAWIDAERIAVGESIPGRIEEGLQRADVILVLISRHSLSSGWCRAEYEPLVTREIESGKTMVLPLRLDDSEMPPLLAAKRYLDVRDGLSRELVASLASSIRRARAGGPVKTLIPDDRGAYECSLLAMIISSTLRDTPIESLTVDQLLDRNGLLRLYAAVERMIGAFEDLVEEIEAVLDEAGVEDAYYGAAYRVSAFRLVRANRHLARIAADMRGIARSLDRMLQPTSRLRQSFGEVLNLCAGISVVEDFLVVRLGSPPRLPSVASDLVSLLPVGEGPEALPVEDNADAPIFPGHIGSLIQRDLRRVLADLDAYRVSLREAVAKASAEPSA